MTEIKITCRIGRGTKYHPAYAVRSESDPGTPWNRIGYDIKRICCGCPNTMNGHARHSASVVAEGWNKVNCRADSLN